MKGQKRKLPLEDVEVSDRSSPAWESQRQFVFSVSLSKYQHGQELPEPSLRRSVLIANTLRQINLEACRAAYFNREMSQAPYSTASSFQVKEQESILDGVDAVRYHSEVANSQSALSSYPLFSPNAEEFSEFPSVHPSVSNNPLGVVEEDEDWGLMSTDPDFSLSAAISSILTALDSTIDGSPQAASRTPLRSLENLSGSFHGAVAGKQGVRGCGSSCEWQEECRARESSMEVMRSSYLSDLTVEDLFQDIDTSLLERDMGVLGLRGSAGGYPGGDDLLRYLPPFSPSSHPFSPSVNQNLKYLPSFSSFSPLSPSFTSSTPSSPFSGQSHVKEGLELDHLMEVLVES